MLRIHSIETFILNTKSFSKVPPEYEYRCCCSSRKVNHLKIQGDEKLITKKEQFLEAFSPQSSLTHTVRSRESSIHYPPPNPLETQEIPEPTYCICARSWMEPGSLRAGLPTQYIRAEFKQTSVYGDSLMTPSLETKIKIHISAIP